MSAPTSSRPSSRLPRGLLLYSVLVCVLAVAAAVVSFVHGSWLGVVWILLAALASNIAWYSVRRDRAARSAAGS